MHERTGEWPRAVRAPDKSLLTTYQIKLLKCDFEYFVVNQEPVLMMISLLHRYINATPVAEI